MSASTANASKTRPKIALIAGTRPEAIKQEPVLRAFRKYDVEAIPFYLEQQSDLLEKHSSSAGFVHHITFEKETLPTKLSTLIEAAEDEFTYEKPDLVLVQGDTTTALAAATAAFLMGIPVGHVEAGLRTYNDDPFPEEMNRRAISTMTHLHFAPTKRASVNLTAEGVPGDIYYVGNTGIDALYDILASDTEKPFVERNKVLVTCHRREGLTTYLPALVKALPEIAAVNTVVWPLHPNPVIKEATKALPKEILRGAVDHWTLVQYLLQAKIVITDSGGIIEEAAELGIPTLVLREHTERPEAEEAGLSRRVRLEEMCNLPSLVRSFSLTDEQQRGTYMKTGVFGDGNAAKRIAEACVKFLQRVE